MLSGLLKIKIIFRQYTQMNTNYKNKYMFYLRVLAFICGIAFSFIFIFKV